MKWNEFEGKIKKEVNTSPSPIDTEVLWQKISQKQKKKGFSFFWFLILGLLIGGFAISSILFNGPIKFNEITNGTAVNKTINNNTECSFDNTINVKNDITTHSYSNKNKNYKSTLKKGVNTVNTTVVRKDGNKSIKNKYQSNQILKFKGPPTKSKTNLISDADNKDRNTNSTFVLISENKSILVTQAPVSRNSVNASILNSEITNSKLKESSTGPFLNSVNSEFQSAPIILPNLAIQLLDYQKLTDNVKFRYSADERTNEDNSFNRLSNRGSVSIYAGLGLWTSQLSTKDSFLYSELANRNEYESQEEYLDAGFNIEKNIGLFNNSALISGFKLQRFTNKLSYTKKWGDEGFHQKAKTINKYISGDSDTSYIALYDTLFYTRKLIHYNSITSISVPLFFRITEIAISPQISLFPIIGINIGFWQSSEGFLLDNSAEIVKIDNNEKIFNKGFSFSWEAQVQANYALSKAQYIYFQAFYMKDIVSRTNIKYSVEQKNSSVGLRLGYGIKF